MNGEHTYRFLLFATLIALLSAFASSQEVVISPSDSRFNKKIADENLTDSLSNFKCSNSAFADSTYNALFDKYTSSDNIVLDIKHLRYGLEPPIISIPLKDFFCMFKDDFNLFCNIRDEDDDNIKITIILQHKIHPFIHMLLVETTKEAFEKGEDNIKSDFYSYIPQHTFINN